MTTIATTALMLASLSGTDLRYPVNGRYIDVATCDNHGNLFAWDELGTGSDFPTDELIQTMAGPTFYPVCPATDDPAMPDAYVIVQNLTDRTMQKVFYVADEQTSFSNVDGWAWSSSFPSVVRPAFRIDNLGVNANLIFESIASDSVFQPGEIWMFIIQDYTNTLGIGPLFGSTGFAGGSPLNTNSTGSIVLCRITAPGTDPVD